ncbi:BON domain-containing protein [Hydrogenophaga sp. 5NK40-0174]|uniref:BON domain-containing protein n=1 Tax=Hydrogenophaga sp. 5NK40-0174 TaxID=3127649 RepID=UPI00310BF77D
MNHQFNQNPYPLKHLSEICPQPIATSDDVGRSTRFQRRVGVMLATTAVAFSLAACGQQSAVEPTVGERVDSAIETTASAAQEARQDLTQAMESTEEKASDVADAVAQKAEDLEITAKVNAKLADDEVLSARQINVDTADGHVTMTGPVASAEAASRATELAMTVAGVKSVVNNLAIRPANS